MDKPFKLWLYAMPVALILIVTLLPGTGGEPGTITFCIACGRRGVADGVLNAVLFLPLGFVPVGGSRSLARRIISGFLLSVFVELTQVFVPGRDPSLSDVVFNTIGTILGAYASRMRPHWLDPDSRDGWILTSAGVVAVIVIATGTILSLSPLHFSDWRTHHVEAELARTDSSDNLEILAMIAVTSSGDTVAVERWGGALGVAYPTWAGAHGLDEPVYWSNAVLEKNKPPLRLSLDIERRSWRISPDSAETHTLGPSIGLGWALLLYPDALGRRWIFLLDGIWLFALCFPIGYWSGRRYFVVACATVVLGFLTVPLVTGASPASFPEWAGVALGFLVGKTAGKLRVPWRSNY
jgi:hypothetical protein